MLFGLSEGGLIMYKVGMQVRYIGTQVQCKGSEFWIVSVAGPILELSLVPGGAGSFYTTAGYVVPIQQVG